MIPFLSQLDLLVAAGVVTGLMGVGGAVFALARHQRPATRPIVVQASEEHATATAAADTARGVAAA